MITLEKQSLIDGETTAGEALPEGNLKNVGVLRRIPLIRQSQFWVFGHSPRFCHPVKLNTGSLPVLRECHRLTSPSVSYRQRR